MAFKAGKLLELRRASGMSQVDTAKKCGLAIGTYQNLEQGRAKDPSLSTVEKIAMTFGVLVEDLINGDYTPQRPGRPTKEPLETYTLDLLGTVGASSPDQPQLFDPPPEVRFAVKYPPGCFALQVTGDSCQGAGIPHGALIVVNPHLPPQDRRFLVVETSDGDYTLKLLLNGELHEFRTSQAKPTPLSKRSAKLFTVKGTVVHVELREPVYGE
jgi:transcriptional regulator with XRE-family HTH domain